MAQNDFFHAWGEAQPRLNPPIAGWLADMPENHAPQLVPPQLEWLNSQNDIWLELPRYDYAMLWEGMLFCAILTLGCTVFIIIGEFSLYNETTWDGWDIFVFATADFAFLSLMMFCLRRYFSEPRDQPIRLNRKRQKIYTFEFQRKAWNPWGKWPVTVRAFDWADVHGEMCFEGALGRGGGWRLYGSVCEPGTYNVTSHFLIASESPAELHQIWSYLCLYMKGEPVPAEAVNKGRPDFWCPCKADKWPADMEYESTTAPETDSPAIPKGKI